MLATLKERFDIYEKLMRLDKPIGILLLLWPTLWALWLSSGGSPDPMIAVIFVPGVVLMRSAGCIINDFADRNFDRHVERTKDRPLAARKIAPQEALLVPSEQTACKSDQEQASPAFPSNSPRESSARLVGPLTWAYQVKVSSKS